MNKIKELYKNNRGTIVAVIAILAIIAGATSNTTDDALVEKLESSIEVADKLLLDEVEVIDISID